jgi:DNA-3-methyladenine glycosylase II
MSDPPALTVVRGTRLVARRDPAMARLIKAAGPMQMRDPLDDNFAALVRSIMYQQLAGAAASTIHSRFLRLFSGGLSPTAVMALPDGAMRSAGVSGAKQAAITDLARKVDDGTVPLHDADALPDDELVARLIQVRGIGRWTAEMFLMFQLGRLDVWPVDDYGVRKGWALAHQLAEPPTPRVLQGEGERFRPYRSVAAWYCWRAVDTALPV